MCAVNATLLCQAAWERAYPRLPANADANRLKAFVHAMGPAIGSSINQKTRSASMSGVVVTGAIASLGNVVGPRSTTCSRYTPRKGTIP